MPPKAAVLLTREQLRACNLHPEAAVEHRRLAFYLNAMRVPAPMLNDPVACNLLAAMQRMLEHTTALLPDTAQELHQEFSKPEHFMEPLMFLGYMFLHQMGWGDLKVSSDRMQTFARTAELILIAEAPRHKCTPLSKEQVQELILVTLDFFKSMLPIFRTLVEHGDADVALTALDAHAADLERFYRKTEDLILSKLLSGAGVPGKGTMIARNASKLNNPHSGLARVLGEETMTSLSKFLRQQVVGDGKDKEKDNQAPAWTPRDGDQWRCYWCKDAIQARTTKAPPPGLLISQPPVDG
jgi:hypothetical protein